MGPPTKPVRFTEITQLFCHGDTETQRKGLANRARRGRPAKQAAYSGQQRRDQTTTRTSCRLITALLACVCRCAAPRRAPPCFRVFVFSCFRGFLSSRLRG